MRCPSCACECREGAAFCEACGARLGRVCAHCGTALRQAARFCDACGRAVAPDAPPVPEPRAYTPRHLAEKILGLRSALAGERKQVTVLFADVKGSMDLAEQVDPEDWHAIMDGFFAILAEGVHRFEGTVNQYTGDGIMALFGAPLAHEDHAARACHAALHLTAGLRRYADEVRRTRGLSFAVRMGLNSGEVVVGAIGDDLRMDYTAQGHTVGLAARMEQLAEPGKVYLTAHTAVLVEGFFALRDLGPCVVKGVREPLRVYELEGLGALRTRLDLSRSRGFSRFVGREDEMAVLDAALASAAAGRGQVVGVMAEPGVGKSRLCWEFLQRCRARGLPVHDAHAVAHGTSMPFLIALELMRSLFGVTPQDTERTARKKIAGTLVLMDEDVRDALPLVCEFLGVADPERPAPRLPPDVRQRRLLAIMRRALPAQAGPDAVVILVEDLHWMDAGSAAYLDELVAAVPGGRVLLLVNFRPEYEAPWMRAPAYRHLSLLPLGPTATTVLLEELLGHDPSLAGLAARIAEHTRGNPFFIEEVVRTLGERGDLTGSRGAYRLASRVTEVTIPPTVQAVLAARIDRLDERDKAVLQTAAVIGKEVASAVLDRVVDLPGPQLAAALDALTVAEFLYEQPGEGYAFSHPLTQEVAYRSQLGERRARMHAAVARAILAVHPDRLDERAALLAHHWEGAGERLEAARWSRRAADWAGGADFPAALHHWRKVRTLIEGLPETGETLELWAAAIRNILMCGVRVRVSDEERAALLAELQGLSGRTGDVRLRIVAIAGPAALQVMSGDAEPALEPLREALQLADGTDDAGLRLALQVTLVLALFTAGHFREALGIAEGALARDPPDVRLGADIFGFNPSLLGLMLQGALLRMTGRLGEAACDLDRAVELARLHGDLEVLGASHQAHVYLAYVMGDAASAFRHARPALEAAERIGSPFWRTQAYEALGLAHLLSEEWTEARGAYTRARTIALESGTGLMDEASYLAGLARAHLGAGEVREARRWAEEAVAAAERRRTRFAECEARLALGQVLSAAEEPGWETAAADAFNHALAVAEDTGAACMEPLIRVAMARLAARCGDDAGHERELRAAHRLFLRMGAEAQAAAVRRELDAKLDAQG